MRVKRRDTEQWMKHRQLPREIVERVRRFDQYKWVATRGVDEEVLVQSLPLDLRRDIKRHLCLDLVRRVCLISFGGCYGYGTLVLILVSPPQGIFSIWFPQFSLLEYFSYLWDNVLFVLVLFRFHCLIKWMTVSWMLCVSG